MSAPNLDHFDSRWQALLNEATVDLHPPDRLGMIGIWIEEDEWHFRPSNDVEVRLPAAAVEEISPEIEPTNIVNAHEARRAIVHVAGQTKLNERSLSWQTAREKITSRVLRGVGAIALGGVRSGAVNDEGYSTPLSLGEHVVAGHLDPSLEAAAAELARHHGLPGFRFSGDSWWTEDFLDALEDPDIGAEHLKELESAGSWPWLTLLVAAPASGAACEVAAIAAAQALLGALVLLDQPPGAPWSDAVPWIAGGLGPASAPRCPGSEDRGFTFPIAPQHLDAMARRLDNAESALLNAPARVIDLAVHAAGPGGGLVVSTVDSSLTLGGYPETLANGCRLAWLAAASETASTCFSLARSAADLLAGEAADLAARAETGAQWRLDHRGDWPGGAPFGSEPDIERWWAVIGEAAGIVDHDLAIPSWGTEAAEQAANALEVAQALFFSHAAGSPG